MAVSELTSALSRRNTLAGIGALMASAAIPAAAATTGKDMEFECKCTMWQDTKAALDLAYERCNRTIASLEGGKPKFPDLLLQPLSLPNRVEAAPQDGWTVVALKAILKAEGYTWFEHETGADGLVMLVERRMAVSWETRKLGMEMFAARCQYDRHHRVYWGKVHEAEELTATPCDEMFRAASAVLEHPVNCIADLARKVQISEAIELWESYDEIQDGALPCILDDIKRLAKAALP